MFRNFAVLFATVTAMALSSAAFAAKPVQIIHVSLTGEAGQPMGASLDVQSLHAGATEFQVKNDAIGTDHEAVLVKLSSKDQKLVVDPKKHRLNESKLNTLGEVAGLKSGDMKSLKVNLQPGEYALVCNHKSHYELGMATRFTVVK